jgi:putative endonuclease
VPGVGDDQRPAVGRLGEQLAAEHLERLGFQILERNFRNRWGELDIIAYDGRVIAFCEVKSRRLRGGGGAGVGGDGAGEVGGGAGVVAGGGRGFGVGGAPFDAVHPGKRARVRRMAGHWLMSRTDRPYAQELRFDAIGITFDRSGRLLALEHLEGAF